jgi:hypothetical protein
MDPSNPSVPIGLEKFEADMDASISSREKSSSLKRLLSSVFSS